MIEKRAHYINENFNIYLPCGLYLSGWETVECDKAPPYDVIPSLDHCYGMQDWLPYFEFQRMWW